MTDKRPRIIHLGPDGDSPRVAAKDFSALPIPYETFNPIQSAVIPYAGKDVNVVIASPTASGKTVAAEILVAQPLSSGGKVLYASPLKALTEERAADWRSESHLFSKYGVSVLTGDHILTDKLRREIDESGLLLLTSEMVDSRARQLKAEKLRSIYEAAAIIIDESHLLGSDSRGDRLETGIMALTAANPTVRLIFLSATLTNASDVARWASELNGKDTVLVESDWRPIPLHVEVLPYYPETGYYSDVQQARVEAAVRLFQETPEDPTVIFVHSKRDGGDVESLLYEAGIPTAFYSSDLSLDERKGVLQRFRQGNINPIISTSALGSGINEAFKTAILCGTHRGIEEVSPIELAQMYGRAGRPQFHTEGLVKILVKADDLEEWVIKLNLMPVVQSQLEGLPCLRFHIVSLVDRKVARTGRELAQWHSRSFMATQGKMMGEKEASSFLAVLEHLGILTKKKGVYLPTTIGRVSSRLYFDPIAVLDWMHNWRDVAKRNLLHEDAAVAWAVGRSEYVGRVYAPKDAADSVRDVEEMLLNLGLDGQRFGPSITAVLGMISGRRIPGLISSTYTLRRDTWRIISAWKWAASSMKLPIDDAYFDRVGTRLQSGCTWEAADLCRVKGLGPVRAQRLVDSGVTSVRTFLAEEKDGGLRATAQQVIGVKTWSRLAGVMVQMIDAGKLTV